MPSHNYAVLLAGGQGSRFWPQSRILEPKQFLSLHKSDTLFESTIKRTKGFIPAGNIYIATSELYRYQILETAAAFHIPVGNIIFETEGRNTAASIGAAARLIYLADNLANMCVLPCDHLIANQRAYIKLLRLAFGLSDERLTVFGIPPDRPATGYGYIKIKDKKNKVNDAHEVDRFTEKPDLKTALRFIREKKYFWNGGIFVGKAKVFLKEFARHQPVIYKNLQRIAVLDDINGIWKNLPNISFDYAILEKTDNLLMVKAKGLGWSDLGSWQAWDETLPKDKSGNSFSGDVINLESNNSTVLGNHRLIATIGLEGLIVVDTPDALLITKKDRSEDVKKIVEELKIQKRQEHYSHQTVKRPWGSYTVLNIGSGFKVKLVEVKPKRSLSLQFHKKRAEHWVVVEGTARITRDKLVYTVHANQSTFIPVASIHRITNTGDSTLKIVEVQTGNYLQEDDIVRLKDDFGRQ